MYMKKIGIIGNGFVGKATFQLKCDNIDVVAYDKNPELCNPLDTSLNNLIDCNIIFVCVPTPMELNGKCHLGIVESVMNDLKSINYNGFIVIRSTVPVGTCDKYNCFFMPEFLTEANFINDFINNPNWIFGISSNISKEKEEKFMKEINDIFSIAHDSKCINNNKTTFLTANEAELVKLFRNCFLSVKVAFCNEMYEFCLSNDINYDNVRLYAAEDKRIGLGHTKVPGPDGKRGFGGTCFPKDMNSMCYQMKENNNCNPELLSAAINRNITRDRPEKDWHINNNRTVVKKSN